MSWPPSWPTNPISTGAGYAGVPPQREATFDELWAHLQRELSRWIGGILVSMSILGTLAARGLKIAGIDNWINLGVLMFLGTFIPHLGAVASAIPRNRDPPRPRSAAAGHADRLPRPPSPPLARN